MNKMHVYIYVCIKLSKTGALTSHNLRQTGEYKYSLISRSEMINLPLVLCTCNVTDKTLKMSMQNLFKTQCEKETIKPLDRDK